MSECVCVRATEVFNSVRVVQHHEERSVAKNQNVYVLGEEGHQILCVGLWSQLSILTYPPHPIQFDPMSYVSDVLASATTP